jgi:hypothetical protein
MAKLDTSTILLGAGALAVGVYLLSERSSAAPDGGVPGGFSGQADGKTPAQTVVFTADDPLQGVLVRYAGRSQISCPPSRGREAVGLAVTGVNQVSCTYPEDNVDRARQKGRREGKGGGGGFFKGLGRALGINSAGDAIATAREAAGAAQELGINFGNPDIPDVGGIKG